MPPITIFQTPTAVTLTPERLLLHGQHGQRLIAHWKKPEDVIRYSLQEEVPGMETLL